MNGWFILSAVSTGVIAVFSIVSFFLARSIKAKSDEYQKQVSDLFQAIAITNILSGLGTATGLTTMDGMIEEFNKHYKGETTIFQ